MRILIAEDERISRRLICTTLEQLGHEVVPFNNGEEAWAAFDANPYRIVVSDWLMPGLDGLELCRRIRQRNETEYTYFILLTANVHGKESYHEAMGSGIDDFLAKPLDRDQIWMRLRVAERILRYTTQISQLESMLPICSYCKKVRNDGNYWQQVETYLRQRTGAQCSHGVCPDCYEKIVKPQLAELKETESVRGR